MENGLGFVEGVGAIPPHSTSWSLPLAAYQISSFSKLFEFDVEFEVEMFRAVLCIWAKNDFPGKNNTTLN